MDGFSDLLYHHYAFIEGVSPLERVSINYYVTYCLYNYLGISVIHFRLLWYLTLCFKAVNPAIYIISRHKNRDSSYTDQKTSVNAFTALEFPIGGLLAHLKLDG